MNETQDIDTLLVLASDTHSGSTTGLMPTQWTSWDGVDFRQSERQRIAWDQWNEGWEIAGKMKKEMGKKTRLIIGHVGDAIDGDHHGTTQIVTKNLDEQSRMHVACMEHGMNIAGFNHRKGDVLRYISGTNIHTGYKEDQIARDFTDPKTGKYIVDPVIAPTAAAEYRDGRFVRHHWRPDINGVLFDIAHHGLGVGGRAWTKSNGIRLAMMSLYFDCLNYNVRMPRYVVSAHLHQYTTEEFESEQGAIRGFVLPGMQFKTIFSTRVARLRNAGMTDVGMMFFRIFGDGTSDYACEKTTMPDTKVEKL